MAKLFLAAVLLLAVVGVAKSQTGNYAQDAIQSAQNVPSQIQNQLGQGQQQGGLLSGLLGNSGPMETIRQIPARGLQMLNNILGGVRNMLPGGLGRNSKLNRQQIASSLETDQLTPQLSSVNLPHCSQQHQWPDSEQPSGTAESRPAVAGLAKEPSH